MPTRHARQWEISTIPSALFVAHVVRNSLSLPLPPPPPPHTHKSQKQNGIYGCSGQYFEYRTQNVDVKSHMSDLGSMEVNSGLG